MHTFSSDAPFSISLSVRRFKAAQTWESQQSSAASWCCTSFGNKPPVILCREKKTKNTIVNKIISLLLIPNWSAQCQMIHKWHGINRTQPNLNWYFLPVYCSWNPFTISHFFSVQNHKCFYHSHVGILKRAKQQQQHQ